jgi:MoaA/NifB/PqqE/SkfB family radical SAM enzyme
MSGRLPAAEPIEQLPVLVLEVCQHCNSRCMMCDHWRFRPSPTESGELEVSLLESWLPGWRDLKVRRIGLTGGEPLLHTEIDSLLETLGDEGLGLTLMTAGTQLERHAEVVARWCDSVVVSLDGPGPVHDLIRGVPGSYSALKAGIEALAAAGKSTRITARCTVQRENFRHLAATVEAAQDLGLDGISFLPVDNSSQAFGRSFGNGLVDRPESLAPDDQELDELAAELESVSQRSSAAVFVAERYPALVERILHHFKADAGGRPHCARPCNAPWVSATIGVDGTARPCFFHPAYGILDRGGELASLLNAQSALGWRQSLVVATDVVCKRCVCPLALRPGEDPR